jgi:hypothetical protein
LVNKRLAQVDPLGLMRIPAENRWFTPPALDVSALRAWLTHNFKKHNFEDHISKTTPQEARLKKHNFEQHNFEKLRHKKTFSNCVECLYRLSKKQKKCGMVIHLPENCWLVYRGEEELRKLFYHQAQRCVANRTTNLRLIVVIRRLNSFA